MNRQTRTNIMSVLGPMYGEKNVYVGVRTTVDVSEVYIDSVNYTEPEWAQDGSSQGRGIIGSRVWSYSLGRDEAGGVGGVVGTEPNADLSTYVERAALNDDTLRELDASGQDDYLVDTEHIQRKGPGGTVTDIMVAVSINGEPGEVLANEQSRQDLVSHIARLSGITVEDEAAKVSLVVSRFWEEEPGTIIDNQDFMWMIYAAIAGLIIFLLLLLIILLILRRRAKKRRAKEEAAAALAAAALAAQAPGETGADIMDIHTEQSMELRKDVRKFAESNPEIAALMLRNWLNGEEEKK